MKKLISILMICAMLAALVAVPASAQIYVSDDFSTFNTNIWFEAGYFEPVDGRLEGYSEAVVHSTLYESDGADGYLPCNTVWNQFTYQVDVCCEPDRDGANSAGLWYANHQPLISGEATDRDTYTVMYECNTSTVALLKNTVNPLDEDTTKVLGTYVVPGEPGANINGDPINLGMKVEAGKITGYVDGVEFASYSDATLGISLSPLILWNNGCHVYFDNFKVGDLTELPYGNPTPDTTAGNGGDDTNGGNEPTPPTPTTPPETEIITKIETDTDVEGNTVTKVVSEVVTKVPADTNTNKPAGGTGAQTGDMVVIVAAVMIIALGSAIVVKKVSSK